MPPIDELTRIEPVYLERLEHQGIFTTGLLLEVSETPTRRQYLADQVDASINDVATWRDEAVSDASKPRPESIAARSVGK